MLEPWIIAEILRREQEEREERERPVLQIEIEPPPAYEEPRAEEEREERGVYIIQL